MTTPFTFTEAVDYLLGKKKMPTSMTTAELRQLSQAFREQSFYSAQTMFEDVLDNYQKEIELLINPQIRLDPERVTAANPQGETFFSTDMGSIRERTKELLRESRYQPDKPGQITDLSSDARINLIINTNRDLAWGNGYKRQGNDELSLDNFPAWQLYRLESRKEPRDWPERFQTAGERCGQEDGWLLTDGGGMFALKNHPIWAELGNSGTFDDALDVDYPPFAFNSGMWVTEVSRAECEAIGLIEPGQEAPAAGETEFQVANN